MKLEVRIPEVGESITEVQVGEWHWGEGDFVGRDAPLVTIETDKVSVELTAPADGRLTRILLAKGAQAHVGDVACEFDTDASVMASTERKAYVTPGKIASTGASERRIEPQVSNERVATVTQAQPWASPAARRALAEHGLYAVNVVEGKDPSRTLSREDVEHYVETRTTSGVVAVSSSTVAPSETSSELTPVGGKKERLSRPAREDGAEFEEQVVPMSPLRIRVAERLVHAQQQAALLTTFNEIDMGNVQRLRTEEKARFEEKHGVKLGLMSFFVRASVEALKATPVVNAEVRGTDIVYKNHYNIGIAVGSGRGLVVPVLRNVDTMGFAAIERAISDFGARAKNNRLELHELSGGTFTISNGGVYGSMLSTPIVNPPQSAILGLHAIVDRPVAREGQVVIRPMMYVALTYDHRIIDGREAVTFLKRIKEFVEQPMRILLEV